MKIDIIIPIYNAYEYTIECVNSILKYTKKEDYNLILINDKSPDERIEQYLNELSNRKVSNILIFSNEENLGFVGTVNKGMAYSNNDIILLNSDTEVTEGWLTKIKTAAYLNEKIATVTPLTNSGTICSIPVFCEDNSIPSEITLKEYADIIEKTSLKLYPSIPTAVGFCMYIKRTVINEIGLFDNDTFGKGYGEENDFCCRALEKGYHHILCDDTFIFHKGSASFTENKKKFIETNLKILFERYPYYPKMVEKFIISNPLKDIHDNIKLQIKIRNNKKNILYVMHNDFIKGENHPIGGTEFHVKDIVDNVEICNSYVMFLNENQINIQAFIDKEIIKFKFELPDIVDIFSFSLNSYKNKVSEILDYFNIDLVHIHHLKTHTFDVIDIAKEKEIPVFLTLHDFYLACPNVNFLYLDKKYCKDIRNKEVCQKCIKAKFGYSGDFLEAWNLKAYNALCKVDKLFAPSKSAKEIFEKYYEEKYNQSLLNIEVVEHGVDKGQVVKYVHNLNEDKFIIAFIGGLSSSKGSAIIHDLIVRNKNKNIEWHLFGNIGDRRLNLLKRADVIKHGRYDRADIVKTLNDNCVDLICIFSIWPETYSYTLSEAISARIPILATDIGALGQRIKKDAIGWTVRHDADIKEIIDSINKVIVDKDDYLIKYDNVNKVNLPSKQEMSQYYEKLYLKSINKRPILIDLDTNRKFLLSYRINNMNVIPEKFEEATIIINELNRKIGDLEHKLNLIQATLGWKLIEYIRNKIPKGIVEIGKRAIYWIERVSNRG
ncbi:glycosyltransferase [Clostridium beijerinckii]|uniref:glycosyltransferase n=1 Tax=Clostridium beijerinckii TaxID=1520 RepID=UPI0023304833|nr:glycosyltransferase [Clostridium beijerinckii]